MVRAKFECKAKAARPQEYGGYNIVLQPVVGGSEENDSFFKLTPGGNVDLAVVSEEAAAEFEVGKQFYVDFTEAV